MKTTVVLFVTTICVVLLSLFIAPDLLAQTTQKRLAGVNYTEGDESPDSVAYRWSGNNSGIFDDDELRFDTCLNYYGENNLYRRQWQSFDVNGNIILKREDEYFPPTNSWIPSSEIVHSYNPNNQRLSSLKRTNYDGTGWSDYLRYTFSYTSEGRIETELFEFKNQDANWVNYSLGIYSYNQDGLINAVLGRQWQEETANWRDNYKNIYSYDSNGNRIGERYQYSGFNADSLEDSYKINFTFNVENKVILASSSAWDQGQQAYNPASFFVISEYDVSNRLVSETSQNLDEDSIVNDERTLYGYENDSLVRTITYEVWWEGQWQPNSEDNQTRIYYEDVILGIEKNPPFIKALIYPNPANEFIMVDISDKPVSNGYEIFDMTGKTIVKSNFCSSGINQINIETLTAGVYFIRAEGIARSFIKQ